MRANILFCLCFFMGLVTQLNAQITITGKVIDEQQQLIPYANVVLLSLPDSVSFQEVSVMKKACLVSMPKKQRVYFAFHPLGMLLFIAFGIAGIQLLELFVSLQIHRC